MLQWTVDCHNVNTYTHIKLLLPQTVDCWTTDNGKCWNMRILPLQICYIRLLTVRLLMVKCWNTTIQPLQISYVRLLTVRLLMVKCWNIRVQPHQTLDCWHVRQRSICHIKHSSLPVSHFHVHTHLTIISSLNALVQSAGFSLKTQPRLLLLPISFHGLTTATVSLWVHLILSSNLSRKFRTLLQDLFSWHLVTTTQHLSWKNCTGFPFQNVLSIKSLVCVSVL